MDDKQFRQLLNFLKLSWDGYKKVRKGVKKKITRHMEQLGCRHMNDYISVLGKNDEWRSQCEQLMAVSISRFFRDRALWQTLESDILPDIVKRGAESVSVWSAGCACGEEVYSTKIVWHLLRHRLDSLPMLDILATDMNPVYLNRATIGIYPQSSLKEVPEELRSSFFHPKNGKKLFVVKHFLKEGISWQHRNLLSHAPQRRFHIIFLRNNLLTYYEAALKDPAFKKIINCLEPKGYLIIGANEKIPSLIPALTHVQGHPYIFQR